MMGWYRARVRRLEAARAAGWLVPQVQRLATMAREARHAGRQLDGEALDAQRRLLQAVLHDLEVQLVGRPMTIWLGDS